MYLRSLRRAHLAAARGRNDSGEQTPFMQTCFFVSSSPFIHKILPLHKFRGKKILSLDNSIIFCTPQRLAPAFLALCAADADVILMIVISVWAARAVEDNNINASKENVTCSSGCGAEPE